MTTSVVYRSALAYELLMHALYGRHYDDRLGAVAASIPPGSSVLELCCGPGTLYERHLRHRTSHYIGVDANERFLARLRRRGVDARRIELSIPATPLPHADVVLMQASLYHFLPRAEEIVDRMLGAARDRVVVSEPIRNLASSRLPLIGRIGRRAADPGTGGEGHGQRFTQSSLDALMSRYSVIEAFTIPGGREKVYVLSAQ